MPLSMAVIRSPEVTQSQILIFVLIANLCAWIPVLLTLTGRPENGYATVWDLLTGTRVVIRPKGSVRPTVQPVKQPSVLEDGEEVLGPYQVLRQLVPGRWILTRDPALRRDVWLLKRDSAELSIARREVARPGRLRWLQKLETEEGTWDAFEATPGTPFFHLIEVQAIPWSSLRHWLHDLASELWDAGRDKTLPPELSLDHIWITDQGRAVLLDQAWPETTGPAELIAVRDLQGRQRFLNAVASCVDTRGLPVHARPVLLNLKEARFEKLSFLTGVLRGMLDRPAEVTRGLRAGSIFMLPTYIWILVLVGLTQGDVRPWGASAVVITLVSILLLLAGTALIQLPELPFRTTVGLTIFRLAVVDANGNPARIGRLLRRWAIIWFPLFVPILLVALVTGGEESPGAVLAGAAILALWGAAAIYSVIHPHRGLHDRLAGTWVVRQ